MSFQSQVAIKQGFSVPGDVFQDVPWVVLPYTLFSNGTPNVVGSTAYTITSEGFAEAGNGGSLGFAGILCIPKSYALFGLNGAPLEATEELPDYTMAELMTQGMLVVSLPNSANIGDYVIYENTTGTLSTIPATDVIPPGYSSAHSIVSQFTQSISGQGLAVIQVNAAGVNATQGQWPYVNTLWLASNGEDTNPGNSQDLPLATLGNALTKLVTGTTNVINIVGAGDYSLTATFTLPANTPVQINAPAANFRWQGSAGGTMFSTPSTSPLSINVGVIHAGNSGVVFSGLGSIICTCPITLNATVFWQDENIISGGVPQALFNVNFDRFGGAFNFGHAGEQVINAYNLGGSVVTSNLPTGAGNGAVKITADFFDGTIDGTADFDLDINYLGGNFVSNTTGEVNALIYKSDLDISTLPVTWNGFAMYNPTGTFTGNTFLAPVSMNLNAIQRQVGFIAYQSPANPTIWTLSPDATSSNGVFIINSINGTITLPLGASVPFGTIYYFAQQVGGGGALVEVQGSDTIAGQTSSSTQAYTGEGWGVMFRGPDNGVGGVAWILEGNFFNSGLLPSGNARTIIDEIDSPALTFTNLATAGQVTVLSAVDASTQYKITDIVLNGVGATNFSGGGGDRDLIITDGTNVWTTIPAATLQALVNAAWGSTDVPFSLTIPLNQASVAGADVYAAYANGTTDYTAGSVVISLDFTQVA